MHGRDFFVRLRITHRKVVCFLLSYRETALLHNDLCRPFSTSDSHSNYDDNIMGAFLGRGLYVDRHKDTVAVAAVTSAAAAAILPWSAPSAAAQAAARAVCVEFGLQLYVSFIAGPTMIFNMERSAFGDIQSKLFPKYGLCTTAIGLWALAAAFFGANKVFFYRIHQYALCFP